MRSGHSRQHDREPLDYLKLARQRRSRAEQTIALMGAMIYSGDPEQDHAGALREACAMFRVLREGGARLLDEEGLTLEFFGAPVSRR